MNSKDSTTQQQLNSTTIIPTESFDTQEILLKWDNNLKRDQIRLQGKYFYTILKFLTQ